jgi:hypothetical protein
MNMIKLSNYINVFENSFFHAVEQFCKFILFSNFMVQ